MNRYLNVVIHPKPEGIGFSHNSLIKGNLKEYLSGLDNNNGILIINIENKDKISYCIYNPPQAETGPTDKIMDSRSYLKEYYPGEKWPWLDRYKDIKKALEYLDKQTLQDGSIWLIDTK